MTTTLNDSFTSSATSNSSAGTAPAQDHHVGADPQHFLQRIQLFSALTSDETTLYKSRGCDTCGGKGLKGRIGIYEVLRMNPEIRQMVAKGAVAEDIHQASIRGGMIDLKAYSGLLLLNGDTSVEEVLQVVSVQD